MKDKKGLENQIFNVLKKKEKKRVGDLLYAYPSRYENISSSTGNR